jgi:hypothetical protein
MPIHDWTRVDAGIFHDFHLCWIAEIRKALNSGLLPPDYYALAEQVAGQIGPDVLALQISGPDIEASEDDSDDSRGTVAAAVAPPKVRFTAQFDMDEYALKQEMLVIRHTSGDEVVALVEIISRGNKASRRTLRMFLDKVATALWQGVHLLIVDLQPPTRRDPQGIHGVIWKDIADASYRRPKKQPLTLVAYDAGPPKTAYVQPAAVGESLHDMPLFLEPGEYILVPLEATYQATWESMPQRWRRVLESPAGK